MEARQHALRSEYSQLLQKFQFALDLSGSVSVVAESVNEDLKHKGGDCQASPAVSLKGPAASQRYLYVLSVLHLGLVLPLLVLQSVLFSFDKVFVVSTVTVQPLGVQVDDICDHCVEEVSVVGDN